MVVMHLALCMVIYLNNRYSRGRSEKMVCFLQALLENFCMTHKKKLGHRCLKASFGLYFCIDHFTNRSNLALFLRQRKCMRLS
ncbi:hypothetical protein DUNSADRAFT_9361 [Dunaliella salina]|uniref:Secreted protein n=1 Tax=Dunaliella salina TaxID=3046 RepID=A0ABQ7H5I2_DUNSA|nr:hypothetical protein DUNSADRAFT_9361 [Dunaliella salina]|eukprot:KAF5842101.1 hypothetical protein DUNSADRAFT_9361 [Dunaliella salina]